MIVPQPCSYAVEPRPIRDGSKVKTLAGSGWIVSSRQRLRRATRLERGKTSPRGERKRDRGTIQGRGREWKERGVCRAKGAKRWDWPVLLWPPSPLRGTPIARMRAKVKLRQVVTLLLPLGRFLAMSSSSFSLSLCLSPSLSRAP